MTNEIKNNSHVVERAKTAPQVTMYLITGNSKCS